MFTSYQVLLLLALCHGLLRCRGHRRLPFRCGSRSHLHHPRHGPLLGPIPAGRRIQGQRRGFQQGVRRVVRVRLTLKAHDRSVGTWSRLWCGSERLCCRQDLQTIRPLAWYRLVSDRINPPNLGLPLFSARCRALHRRCWYRHPRLRSPRLHRRDRSAPSPRSYAGI